MLDDCTHAIDTVRWMCGGRSSAIESHCKRIGVPDINWIGAMLQFDNGATGFVVNSWASGRRIFRVQMHARKSSSMPTSRARRTLYAGGNVPGVEYDSRKWPAATTIIFFGGFHAKHRQFVDSLKYGEDVTSSPFRDCLQTMEVAEKILAQALLRGE